MSHFDAYRAKYHLCLGGEAEYWTLREGRLAALSTRIFPDRESPVITLPHAGRILAEMPIQQVEVTSGICANAIRFHQDMMRGERALMAFATQHGFVLDTTSTPPHEGYELDVFPEARYLGIKANAEMDGRDIGGAWTVGFHSHCGFESIEAYICVHNMMRLLLGMILALSIPEGQSGSARVLSWLSFVKGGICPPVLESRAHLLDVVEELFDGDWSQCYWGYRPNVPIGTGETRIPEMQRDTAHMAQLAAVLRVLAAMAEKGQYMRGIMHDPEAELLSVARGELSVDAYGYHVRSIRDFAATNGFVVELVYIQALINRLGLESDAEAFVAA